MRVLFLNPAACMGGAETSLIELLAGLRIAQPEWELHLLLSADGPLVPKSSALGVTVTVLPFSAALARVGDAIIEKQRRWSGVRSVLALAAAALAALRYSWQLSRAIRSIAPDLVHTNGIKMHLLGAVILRNRLPLVWHVHDYLGQRRLMKWVLQACAPWCRAIIANSRSVAADLKSIGISPEIVPIYNAVDFDRFAPAGDAYNLDRLSGMPDTPDGCLRIGLLATFARWKGHLTFLEAIGKLPQDIPFRAYIIGGPVYQTAGSQFDVDELRSAAARYCPGRVGFTGIAEDSAQAIRALDIVVHASTRPEPFGMVIVEGMACGKPVIASRAGGAAELFEEGRTAIGHHSGDSESLAHELLALMGNPALRRELGAEARRSVMLRFDRATMSAEVASLYRRCRFDDNSGGSGKWREAEVAV